VTINPELLQQEANIFALCLLIPEDVLRSEVRKLCPDGFPLFYNFEEGTNPEKVVSQLAKIFKVSEPMIWLRLGMLLKP